MKQYEKTERDLQALQSVGQIIGDILKALDSVSQKEKNLACFLYLCSDELHYMHVLKHSLITLYLSGKKYRINL